VIAAGAAIAAAGAVTHLVAKLNFAVLWKISAPPHLGSRDRHSAFQNRLFVKSFWTSWPPRSWPRPTTYYSPCWQNWELLRNFGWFKDVWENKNSQIPIRKRPGITIQENLFSNGPTIQETYSQMGLLSRNCYSHSTRACTRVSRPDYDIPKDLENWTKIRI